MAFFYEIKKNWTVSKNYNDHIIQSLDPNNVKAYTGVLRFHDFKKEKNIVCKLIPKVISLVELYQKESSFCGYQDVSLCEMEKKYILEYTPNLCLSLRRKYSC